VLTSACRLSTGAHPEQLVADAMIQDAPVTMMPAAGGAGSVAPNGDAGAHGGASSVPAAPDAATARDGSAAKTPQPRIKPSNTDASRPQARDSSTDDAGQAPQECTPELAFDFATCLATDPFDPTCIANAGPCAGLASAEDAATAADGG
jgi:hypothetical protein